jgi:hypothetical protein
MSTRHDPLSVLSPPVYEPPATPVAKAQSRKQAKQAKPGFDVPDSMLAFLAPGRPVAEVRADFAAFCAARKFGSFRQAWAAFDASTPAPPAPEPEPVQTPRKTPIWLQQYRQQACAYLAEE